MAVHCGTLAFTSWVYADMPKPPNIYMLPSALHAMLANVVLGNVATLDAVNILLIFVVGCIGNVKTFEEVIAVPEFKE